jgi:ABC-type metal ion transport system substrate-binding protein
MISLTKDQANKITRIDNGDVVTIPAGVFAKGDMLILFNNSDGFITLESKIEKTYQSATKWTRTMIEWPPRAIVNVIFVDDDLVVASVGIT